MSRLNLRVEDIIGDVNDFEEILGETVEEIGNRMYMDEGAEIGRKFKAAENEYDVKQWILLNREAERQGIERGLGFRDRERKYDAQQQAMLEANANEEGRERGMSFLVREMIDNKRACIILSAEVREKFGQKSRAVIFYHPALSCKYKTSYAGASQ